MSRDVDLMKMFTDSDNDFLSVEDLKEMSGLAESRRAKPMRDVKAVSDVFGLNGRIRRVDHYKYIRYVLFLGRRPAAVNVRTRHYRRKKAE